MNYKLLFLALLLCLSTQMNAAPCRNAVAGQVDIINFDLSSSVNSSNNIIGGTHQLWRGPIMGVFAVCPVNSSADGATYRSYVTNLPIILNSDGFKYLQLNEYLLGALRITDANGPTTFYPPVNYVRMGIGENVNQGLAFEVQDISMTFRIRVVKPFINFMTIPEQTMFTVFVTSNASSSLSTPVYKINYSGSFSVPESCVINAGQDIIVDVGKIPAIAFAQAGIGGKPNGIQTYNKQVTVQCSNIDSAATLTLRLEAEKSNGDIMESSNADIGFKIADSNGKILAPNSINSSIPFKLIGTLASVPLSIWPVSSTGKVPQLGPFSSNGYIRIDFD